MRRIFSLGLAAAALASAVPAAARAQDDAGWNSPRALELVTRAQERRARTQADTGLVDYQADARGYIYFYLDRRDTGERTLVKTDQVALDVLWKAPAYSKQRIIGLRDEKKLPTSIRYHEDHLTVVQDNFGDLIRLGDGDEVRDVLHPAAPAGHGFYDYRLADSLSIRLPGAGEPVRVYELEVRPRDLSRPAFVGSVYVDRRQGDIVRMDFTFTAASYVDRQLDYINVSLENGLWKGRFWLPNRQQVELRRQLPELGFPAGGVIRGTMRIGNYRFNQELPAALFAGRRVVSVPEAQRRSFAFEDPLHAELHAQGIGPDTELGEIRRQAAEIVRRRMLSGLPGTRVDAPAASGVARYNRAEGLALGFGVRSQRTEQLTVGVRGGWAFGPMHPVAAVEAIYTRPAYRLDASAFAFEPRDVGVGPAVSGAMNTLTALLAGRDYTDPFYASGAALRLAGPVGRGWGGTLRLRAEAQESAALEADVSLAGEDGFRPVSPVDEGTLLGGAVALTRGLPSGVARGWTATLAAEAGHLRAEDGGDVAFLKPRVEVGVVRRWPWREAALEVDARAGAAVGTLPRQELYLLGGRGTVPGFDFRAYGGDRFALLRATASADVASFLLRGRVTAAGGWVGSGSPSADALRVWPAVPTADPIVSVGAGIGLFYDILRVDVARGLGPGGRWELIVEANPAFWDFL